MRRPQNDDDCLVLCTSHDLDLTFAVADRILVLREGRLILNEKIDAESDHETVDTILAQELIYALRNPVLKANALAALVVGEHVLRPTLLASLF